MPLRINRPVARAQGLPWNPGDPKPKGIPVPFNSHNYKTVLGSGTLEDPMVNLAPYLLPLVLN